MASFLQSFDFVSSGHKVTFNEKHSSLGFKGNVTLTVFIIILCSPK